MILGMDFVEGNREKICIQNTNFAVHDMQMSNGVMTMTEVENGIMVSAGKMVSLAPGGLHLMFMGLIQQLKTGDEHTITLTFDNCGDLDVSLPVASNAMSGHNQSSHKNY